MEDFFFSLIFLKDFKIAEYIIITLAFVFTKSYDNVFAFNIVL